MRNVEGKREFAAQRSPPVTQLLERGDRRAGNGFYYHEVWATVSHTVLFSHLQLKLRRHGE